MLQKGEMEDKEGIKIAQQWSFKIIGGVSGYCKLVNQIAET